MHTSNAKPQLFKQQIYVGIWDALQRKYLRRIAFQILDASSGELLEEYVFSVLMQQASIVLDGGGRGGGGGGGGGGAKDKQQHNQGRNAVTNVAPTKEMVKKQASHLIRVLCQLVATLEPLPTKEDGITVDFNLQLGYSNETPDDYEPPFFRHVHVRDLPLFPVEPLDARVGKMSTGDMHVGCKLRSILADVIIEQRRQQQQQQQQQLTTAHAFPLAALPGGARNDTSSPKATTGQRINMASTAHAAMRGLTRTESEASEGDTEDQFRGQHHVAHAAPRQESCEGKRRTSMELDGATHTWLNIAPAMADESQASDVGGAYTRRKRRKVTSASQSSFDASSFAGYLTHA